MLIALYTFLRQGRALRRGSPDPLKERSMTDRRRGVLPALFIATFTAAFAQTVVVAALPAFGRELAAPANEVVWVLTAFMLSSAVATPIAGKLGDMLGYRRVLTGCLCCFTIGSVVAGLATNGHSLGLVVTGRALQGVVGGAFPLAFGMARATLPPRRISGVVAVLSAIFGVGGAAGMVVAGPIVDGPGTAWLFWFSLLLGLIALGVTGLLPATHPARAGRVDVAGAALLSGVLVCLLLAISQGRTWGWGSVAVISLFAVAIPLLAVFTAVELRAAEPLVDLRLMRGRALVTANLATLVVAAAMFGGVTLFPQFMQTPSVVGYGFGLSVTEAGLAILSVAIPMLVVVPLAARLGARFGHRAPLRAGAACAIVAYLILTVADDRLWYFCVAGLLIGAGNGLAFAAVGNLVVEAVDPGHTGASTGVNTIIRTLGAAIGAQLAAAILTAHTPAGARLPTESGYTTCFLVLAAIATLALTVAFTIRPARPTNKTPSQPPQGPRISYKA